MKGVDEVWTQIKKDSTGTWMTVGGPLTKFDVEWGENEPNTADGTNCAVLSKVKGYRLREPCPGGRTRVCPSCGIRQGQFCIP